MRRVPEELLSLPVEAIESAMDEFDDLGETSFLERYGYKPAYRWVVESRGRQYPPRALAAAAYSKVHGRSIAPDDGPRRLMPKHLRSLFRSPSMKIVDLHPIKSVGRVAVEAALDEYDRLGRTEFLKRYGYREAREYYLVREVNGKRQFCDSKAILGAAYGFQHPTSGPLTPGEFSGGETVTTPILEGLGYEIVSIETEERVLSVGSLRPGHQFRQRSEIHEALGGQTQGGISTPQGKDYILLFSGPSGEQYGYYDGWDGDTFLFAGEGQSGDMTFDRGNRAVRDHVQDGKRLLLFQKNQLGAHRYEGTFVCEGHDVIRGHDVNGHDRAVIQFRLALEGAGSPQKPTGIGQATRRSGSRSQGGQGRVQSYEERKAIERHAVDHAIEFYMAESWDVEERGKPFDLLCMRGSDKLYVEVKGTKSAGSSVTLTRNEVDHMRQHFPATALYIVSGVDVEKVNGDYVVEGGEVLILHPWVIEDENLRITEYSYTVPES